jgi:hypothetical protein
MVQRIFYFKNSNLEINMPTTSGVPSMEKKNPTIILLFWHLSHMQTPVLEKREVGTWQAGNTWKRVNAALGVLEAREMKLCQGESVSSNFSIITLDLRIQTIVRTKKKDYNSSKIRIIECRFLYCDTRQFDSNTSMTPITSDSWGGKISRGYRRVGLIT